MKYLIYLRVSTIKQDAQTQLDYCLKFIKMRDQTDFRYEVYSDTITSKRPLVERAGGMALLAAMSKGDIVIAMRLDRLARKLHETTQLIHILETKGCDVLLVQQPGIKNKIMLGLYAGMAEEEVKLLRSRISEKLTSKKDRGERYSGKIPYGWTMHETHMVPIKVGSEVVYKPGVLVPLESEQAVLTRIYRYADMGLGYQAIAKVLTEEGYRNREGNPFQKMSIYRALNRRDHTKSEDQPHLSTELQSSDQRR
jgi:DNA invertase Pin-like site-specific DNA recombinase